MSDDGNYVLGAQMRVPLPSGRVSSDGLLT